MALRLMYHYFKVKNYCNIDGYQKKTSASPILAVI
jgi:hypothetical protein